jgi:hypothetical protein
LVEAQKRGLIEACWFRALCAFHDDRVLTAGLAYLFNDFRYSTADDLLVKLCQLSANGELPIADAGLDIGKRRS